MSNNVHVLNLSAFTTPEIKESKQENWVDYGSDNNFFGFLLDRYTNSTTNNAIINNISRLVYGRGLSAVDASRKPNEYAQAMALFHKDCLRKIALDRKMLGQFAIQVHYNEKHDRILKAYHIPVNLLRAEKCNKDGEIEGYYYCDDWTDTKKYVPVRYSAFGKSKDKIEILYSKPYSVGMKYYSYVDYQGAVPYALLEEEIADYLINEVQNGFSGTKVINFNNGQPSVEQQEIITSKVMSKLTGSLGQKVIVAFNDNMNTRTTVDDLPLNDAPEHYQYLSEECMRKIMLGHNVTSPLLFGIAGANGFSSNADELQNSFILFNNMVIKPIQDEIIEALNEILAFNNISLTLFFKTLKPLEFTDLENAMTEEQVAEETGTELSKHDPLDNEIAKALIELGEEPNENWLLIDEFPVDYDNDDAENELLSKDLKKSLFSKLVELVSTGDARPNISSRQDKTIDGIQFLTRYVYEGKTSTKSRKFCQEMMKAGKIYRKEDIDKMSKIPVNAGWGARGAATYDIFKFKGGGNCHHRWNKQVYATFKEGSGINLKDPEVKRIAVKKAEKLGYVVKNSELVSQRPVDMDNYGFLPSNPQPKRTIVN